MKTHDGFSEPKPDAARQQAEDDYERRLASLDRAIRHLQGGAHAGAVISMAKTFDDYLKGEPEATKAQT